MSYYRDRRPERPDIPEEDRYGSGSGQSYRPGRRSPPPGANPRGSSDHRPARSPPPSHRDRPYMNSYHPRPRSPPPTYQSRPRSPDFRSRDSDGYRSRPISPARRPYGRDEPRTDSYRTDRDDRDDTRYRPSADRSAPPRVSTDTSYVPQKRSRDASPISSRGRLSPGSKRGRMNSPPPRRYENNYRPVSPDRMRRIADRPLPPQPAAQAAGAYRRRSPSPAPRPRREEDIRRHDPPRRNDERPARRDDFDRRDEPPRREEGPRASLPQSQVGSQSQSASASRQSSPPVHPSRAGKVPMDGRSAGAPSGQGARERDVPSRPLSPAHQQVDHDSMPPRRRSPPPRHYDAAVRGSEQIREPAYPSRSRDESPASARPVPTGPSGTRQQSFNQPATMAPRDREVDPAWNSYRPQREDSRASDGSSRPARGSYGGPPAREPSNISGPPTGPRNGPPGGAPRGPASLQTSRSQRFSTAGSVNPTAQYLAGMPQIVEGGRKLPPVYDKIRLDKLDEEHERLRKVVDERQSVMRKGMREWDRLQRESEAAGFRADLADQAVRSMAGEDLTASAAF